MLVIEDMFCVFIFLAESGMAIKETVFIICLIFMPLMMEAEGWLKGHVVVNVNLKESYPDVFYYRVVFYFSTQVWFRLCFSIMKQFCTIFAS